MLHFFENFAYSSINLKQPAGQRGRGVMKTIRAFIKDESGATAIEYGLVAAFVSLAGITAMTSMGNSLSTFFTSVTSSIESANSGG